MDIIMLGILVAIALMMWRGVRRNVVIGLWLFAVVFLIGEFLPHLHGPELSF